MRKENTYILNLDASYILKEYYKKTKLENKKMDKVILNREKLDKFYNATVPYSLETIRMGRCVGFIEDEEASQQKTIKLINVTFDKNIIFYKDDKKISVKKSTMRKYLYNNGFYINGLHYKMYKRGASKAKTGSVLFILKNLHKTFQNRSRLGLEFEENEEMDLTSAYAYESLILSGLIDTIEIDPSRILIINDINGKKFKTNASVTREVNKQLVTKDEEIEIQNCLTDGMSLLDESYFDNYATKKRFIEKIKQLKNNKCRKKVILKKASKKYILSNSIKSEKTMFLLRNDWFKSNAINTKLHKFLDGYAENGKVKDMFGRERDIRTVDLVITPNSLKWLKLKDKFESKSKEECYDYWVRKIDKMFGIVKTDKIGNFADCNRTTYQLLNSMQLVKNEIKELAKEEIDYVNMLKNDIDVFKMHIGNDLAVLKIEEALKDKKKELDSTDMMSDLLAINHNFQRTRKFKIWRKAQIEQYLENLKCGKLRLSNTRYTTIISNPYAMLQAIVGKYKEGECVESGHVIWCNAYKEDQEFCISRNPHINAGNIMYAKNKYYKEYEWFNLSENMCVINANDTDVLDRLQGCDVDSDIILMLTHEILIKHAKENKWLTPINKVKGQKELKKNNMDELAKLDHMLQTNLIGDIINTSAIYNAYMNRAINNNENKDIIQKMYDASSMLSSLSQIELDRSKKSFPNIEMNKELARIKKFTDGNSNPILEKREDYIYKTIKCFDIEREVSSSKNIKKDFKYNSIKKYKKIKLSKKWTIKEDINSKKKIRKIKTQYSIKKYYYFKDDLLICNTKIYKKVKDVKKVNKTVVPNFFNVIAENSEYRIYENFNISMDYLQEILQTEINRKEKTNDIEFKKIIESAKNVSGSNVNKKQLPPIKETIMKYGKALNRLKCKNCILTDEQSIVTYKRNRKNEALKELTHKVNAKTILYILKECYCKGKTDWSKYAMHATNLLYIKYKKEILECFKTEWNDKEMVLIENKNGNIKIWNKNYKKITKKEYIKMGHA